MALIFPPHSPILSTLNSSGLYLEKRVNSVSCCEEENDDKSYDWGTV